MNFMKSTIIRRCSLILAITAALFVSTSASATEWWVAPNGTGNGQSQGSPSGDLQAIIDHQQLQDGDVIKHRPRHVQAARDRSRDLLPDHEQKRES